MRKRDGEVGSVLTFVVGLDEIRELLYMDCGDDGGGCSMVFKTSNVLDRLAMEILPANAATSCRIISASFNRKTFVITPRPYLAFGWVHIYINIVWIDIHF